MKSVKTILFSAAVLAATALHSSAITSILAVEDNFGGGVVDSSMTLLADGSATGYYGTFTTTGTVGGMLLTNAQVMAIGADPMALLAKMVVFGSTTTFNRFGSDGSIFGAFQMATFDPNDADPDGIGSNTGGGSSGPQSALSRANYDLLDVANAQVYGLFVLSDLSEVGVMNSGDTLDTLVNGNPGSGQSIGGFESSGATAVIGSFAGLNTGAFGFGESLQLTMVVPEPSRALLGLVGVVGILMRRRRA